jgi:hypothetical protein
VGEAGPVEQSSAEAKSLKLRAKGLSGCHPSGQQPRQPDRGPKGQNKEPLSGQFTKRSTVEQKQPAKESTTIKKKEKCLLYAPNLKLQKGKMLKLMKV